MLNPVYPARELFMKFDLFYFFRFLDNPKVVGSGAHSSEGPAGGDAGNNRNDFSFEAVEKLLEYCLVRSHDHIESVNAVSIFHIFHLRLLFGNCRKGADCFCLGLFGYLVKRLYYIS